MTKKPYSTDEKDPELIKNWFDDQQQALNVFRDEVIATAKKSATLLPIKFQQLEPAELINYFNESEREIEHLFSFDVIAATEAILRLDFQDRVTGKRRSEITRQLRTLQKQKGDYISLEEDILQTWKDFNPREKKRFSDLIGLLKYRHWLAHGRCWVPNLGREYNFKLTYFITKEVTDFIKSH
ncbi:MAG: hypothetical protein WDO14_08345 [Bacteroidota bacterium]